MSKQLSKIILALICSIIILSQAQVGFVAAQATTDKNQGISYAPENNDLTIKLLQDSVTANVSAKEPLAVSLKSEIVASKAIPNDIKIDYTLQKVSDDGYRLEEIPQSKNISTLSLKNDLSAVVPINFSSLESGRYEIKVSALSDINDSLTIGNSDVLRFTVDDNKTIKVGWEKDLPNMVPATSESSKLAEVYSDPFSIEYGTVQLDEKDNLNLNNSIQATVTLSGKWMHYNRGQTTTSALKKATVEVRYRDQFYIWRTAATTTTDANGNWSVSYTPPSSHNLWEVRVVTTNSNYGKIQNTSNSTYNSYTQYLDLSTGGNIGTWIVTSGTYTDYAFWMWSDMVKAKDALNSYKNPGTATIVWPINESKAYYTHGDKIYMGSLAHASSTITLHELGHNYMYNIYGSMPTSNCKIPNKQGHDFPDVSEPGCAWVEGWASMLAFYINNSPVYEYYGGGSRNLEVTSSFPDEGEKVEGLVVGAL